MSVRGGMLDALSTLDGSMNRVIRLVMSVELIGHYYD